MNDAEERTAALFAPEYSRLEDARRDNAVLSAREWISGHQPGHGFLRLTLVAHG